MKLSKVLVFLLILIFCKGYGYEISDYPYKSKYDDELKNITDVSFISNALEDSDIDLVFSALKKVGELRLTNLKPKVISLIGSSTPQANLTKSKRYANYRHIFYMGILVMGKIGNSSEDATYIASFLRDTKTDVLGTICILTALGELSPNETALDFLHQYSLSLKNQPDSRVVRTLVDAILAHKNRSSIPYLVWLRKKVSQNDKIYVNEAIIKLGG